MSKRFTIFAAALLAVVSLLPSSGRLEAQNRHVYLEEFTGSWCGYCPRGAYADQKLDEKYGDQVAIVSIHGPFNPGTFEDPMQTPQTDSMLHGVGLPVAEGFSYPGGWTARQPVGNTWNVDPTAWIHPLTPFVTATSPGLVDTMVGQPAAATVSLDNVSFDLNTHMITAKVTAKFVGAMTGDFRLNIMVTEDSVSGPSGTPYTMGDYDQTNYYYQCTQLGDASNPFYNMGSGQACDGQIAGWMHRHVFREAVAGIWGAKGIIPPTTVAGTAYSQTFSFLMPSNVLNPNHVHLVAIVHQYSATDINKNTVYDAAQAKLTSSSISVVAPLDISIDGIPTSYAHAKGDTSFDVTVTNNGNAAATVTANSSALPSGWSIRFSPSPLTVNGGATGTETVTISAPEQSAFIAPTITFVATEASSFVPSSSVSFSMLSDNTVAPLWYYNNTIENAAVIGIPDSLKLHTSLIPLTADMISTYSPDQYDINIYNNVPILDHDGYFTNARILSYIQSALDNGKKVFLNSDMAMYYAFDPNYTNSQHSQTQDVQDFYARLGLNYSRTVIRYNNSTGAIYPFPIKGTTDPIGNGISVTNSPNAYIYSTPYTIDSNSVALFYTTGASTGTADPKYIIGSRYEDPHTHGRIVYLGFNLSGITVQKTADTIDSRSMRWLLSSGSSGVTDPPASSNAFTASPNPFVGSTQVAYTAAAGERDVTFSVVDLLGREVEKLAPKATGDSYSVAFDGSNLAAGTYVIVAHTSTGSHQIRVVNEH